MPNKSIRTDYLISLAQILNDYRAWLAAKRESIMRGSQQEPIIDKENIILIYKNFKDWFPYEKEETWIQRFIYPSNTFIDAIKIGLEVKDNNDKLILISILGQYRILGNTLILISMNSY